MKISCNSLYNFHTRGQLINLPALVGPKPFVRNTSVERISYVVLITVAVTKTLVTAEYEFSWESDGKMYDGLINELP